MTPLLVRLIALSVIFLFPCYLEAVEVQLQGVWSDGNSWENSKYTIYQNGSQICGFWYYFATNASYEGRFTGIIKGNKLETTAICGVQGGLAQTYCPKPSDFSSAIDVPEQDVGWSSEKGFVLMRCNDKLLENPHGKCGDSSNKRVPSLKKLSSTPKIYKSSSAEQTWLIECLGKANPSFKRDWLKPAP